MMVDLTGATVLEADSAGVRLRLADGREAEIFPTSERIGARDVPTLVAYES